MTFTTLNGGLDFTYNWDSKLRKVNQGNAIIMSVKYDPDGNRIYNKTVSEERKYIVDIAGDLPVILMELNNSGDIVKTYIYANSRIIAQHTGDHEADRYFYLHDRLGSVRQIIDTSGNVKNRYTYNPFGKLFDTEKEETVSNPFKFTGQYFDSEIDQYYLRARQYDPHVARFTSRDPVFGEFKEPLTLHMYLYCQNEPINFIDPSGETYGYIENVLIGLQSYYGQLDAALRITGNPADMLNWLPEMNARREYLFSQEVLNNPHQYEHINFLRFMTNPGPFCPIPLSLDPSQPPGPGWVWRGSPPLGGPNGAWWNPKTNEHLSFDNSHHLDEYPHGHWDYRDLDGKWWRVDPKTGEMTPK